MDMLRSNLLPLPILDLEDICRFWTKVTRLGPDECWLWEGHCSTGLTRRMRRPAFKIRYINYPGTRISYLLHYGKDPGQLLVCHTCTPRYEDPQLCVNPNHLWLGTDSENQQDSHDKGTGQIGNRSKLLDHDVLKIRERFAKGEGPTQIGLDYNLTRQSIHRIVTQQTFSKV